MNKWNRASIIVHEQVCRCGHFVPSLQLHPYPFWPQPRWDLCIGSSQHARYLLWASQSPCLCPHSCKQCQVFESFILLVLVALRSYIWILESQSTSIARTKSKLVVFRSIAWQYFATGFARFLVDSVMTHSQLGLSRHQKGRRPQLAPQNTKFSCQRSSNHEAEAIALSFVLSKSNRISWWMPLARFLTGWWNETTKERKTFFEVNPLSASVTECKAREFLALMTHCAKRMGDDKTARLPLLHYRSCDEFILQFWKPFSLLTTLPHAILTGFGLWNLSWHMQPVMFKHRKTLPSKKSEGGRTSVITSLRTARKQSMNWCSEWLIWSLEDLNQSMVNQTKAIWSRMTCIKLGQWQTCL